MSITFKKRQKEMKRQEKQRAKAERREQKKFAKRAAKEAQGTEVQGIDPQTAPASPSSGVEHQPGPSPEQTDEI